ncbi:hypothetical protein XENORESO_015336 [Xenotaenia resolanae]|uniref:Uncharacterized protein n=1 Tax=Xenotaenia resolanae TaxID=208358 RepID=A0ABV0W5J0_9TELE
MSRFVWNSKGLWEKTCCRNFTLLLMITLPVLWKFSKLRGKTCEHLAQLLQQMQSLDPTEKRTVLPRGLPHLLGDNPTEFFKSSFISILFFFIIKASK